MHRWFIRSAQVAALALGGLALTGTAAHADWDTGFNAGSFNGNQSSTTVQMPVNVCGNAVAIAGFASANCSGGAYASNGNGGSHSGAGSSNGHGNANATSHKKHHHHHNTGGAYASNNSGNWTSGYNAGFFNGNQSSTTIQAPINVSCNAVAVLGFAQSC